MGSAAGCWPWWAYQEEGAIWKRQPFPQRGVLQHSLLTSSQLVKEKSLQGPALLSQTRQWRVDLELRSNQLRTGTVCAGRGWIALWKFWVWGAFGVSSWIMGLDLERGLSWRYGVLEMSTDMWQSLGHGCNCPEKISYLKRKDAKDKGKQHMWKGSRGKRAHERNQQTDHKTLDLWF